MERIVDVSSDGLSLGVSRGFMIVSKDREEIGRIAFDDIGGVIAHAHGLNWTNNVLVRLAESKVPVVICGSNHAPMSVIWPLEGHYSQAKRCQAQAAASKPLKKQIWAQIVIAKIKMQAKLLEALDKKSQNASYKSLEMLARKVCSGDPQNLEAQAARKYWPLLFGKDFRRDQESGGINALLNYGYTILRSCVARSLCAAGLHPTLGVFHCNNYNAFALADDVMEPFRPLVDAIVYNLAAAGQTEITAETKQILASISSFDLEGVEGTSPLFMHINYFAYSLATSFENGKAQLVFPNLPSCEELRGLGAKTAEQRVADLSAVKRDRMLSNRRGGKAERAETAAGFDAMGGQAA